MRRLVLTLSDAEYADLERQALAERRTPKQMAEYLVTRQQTVQIVVPSSPPWNPIWPPNVWCDSVGTTTTPPTNGTICSQTTNTIRMAD